MSLTANIRSFHHAVKTENRLNGIEARMAELETEQKELKSIKKKEAVMKKQVI